MKTIKIENKVFEPYLSQQIIEDRIAIMAKAIKNDYQQKDFIAVCVLKGAFMFFTDLVKSMNFDFPIGFIRVSSYQNDSSTGKIKQLLGLTMDLKDKHILVVDDILDTGFTFEFIRTELMKQNPASVSFATLLYKKVAVKNNEVPAYYGFEIPNHFVIGYGLDYNENGRNYADIYKLSN